MKNIILLLFTLMLFSLTSHAQYPVNRSGVSVVEGGGILPWEPAHTYDLNNVVYINDKIFVSKTLHTSSPDFNDDRVKWIELSGGGVKVWKTGIDYNLEDLVYDSSTNKIYRCVVANTAGAVFLDQIASWTQLAYGVGPIGASTDRAFVIFDGITGDKILDTSILLSPTNDITGVNDFTALGSLVAADLTISGLTTLDPSLDGILFSTAGVVSANLIIPIENGGTNSAAPLVDDLVMISDTGAIVESTVTVTELGNLSASTSNIQDQLDAKVGLVSPSTDMAIAKFNGVTGALQDSGVIIDASDNVTGVKDLTMVGGLDVTGYIKVLGDLDLEGTFVVRDSIIPHPPLAAFYNNFFTQTYFKIASTGLTTDIDFTMNGTGALKVPAGLDAERPVVPAQGMLRFNTTKPKFEGYDGSKWAAIGGSGGGASHLDWDTESLDAPSRFVENGVEFMVFANDDSLEANSVFKLGSSYSEEPVTIKIPMVTKDDEQFAFNLTATLIKVATDFTAADTVTVQAVISDTALNNEYYQLSFKIVDEDGKLGATVCGAGDLILLKLTREKLVGSPNNLGDVNVLKKQSEILIGEI